MGDDQGGNARQPGSVRSAVVPAFARIVWRAAAIVFAANWLYNAAPGKWRQSWYSVTFETRVSYFTQGNPLGPVHHFLTAVVLTHSAAFAALSAAGETTAALLLLFAPTVRLGGAAATAVAISYSLGSSWVNTGYAVHNGSFALLGLLFTLVGGELTLRRPWILGTAAMAGLAGAAFTWQMGHVWEGWWPAEPWVLASTALLVASLGGAMQRVRTRRVLS